MARSSVFIAGVGIAAFAGLAAAQSSVLYFSQYGGGPPSHLIAVQNGAVLYNTPLVGGTRQYGIAVADDIRTVDYLSWESGGRYDLNGNFLGTTYQSGLNPNTNIYDATTDGKTSNWACDGIYGTVYRWDRNWEGPGVAFTVPNWQVSGIGYDPGNGTLWVTGRNEWSIAQYKTDGTFVSSFPILSANYSLAFEPSSGTIWLKRYGSYDVRQYDRSGNLLATVNMPFLTPALLGMEFAIPAPGALGLLGVGGLVVLRRRRD